MVRDRCLHALLALAVCVALPCRIVGDSGPESTKYQKTVLFGFAEIQASDGCVTITANASAGDFFTHLRKTRSGNDIEFRTGSALIKTFPENVTIVLHGSDYRIDPKCSGIVIPMKNDGESSLMKSLQFKTFWQRDSATREAIRLSIKTTSDLNNWFYILSIQSRDVPLTDHLILSAFDGAGNKVATFSIAL